MFFTYFYLFIFFGGGGRGVEGLRGDQNNHHGRKDPHPVCSCPSSRSRLQIFESPAGEEEKND